MPRQLRPAVPPALKPWIDSFELALTAGGKSPLTVQRYTDAAGWLAGWLAANHPVADWDKVDHKRVQKFLVHLQASGYSRKYVHNIGGALQQFFAWWSVEEDLPNPMTKVTVPAAPKLGEQPPAVLATEQLAALLKDAESGRDFESRRDAALLRLFASSGGRLSEITNLNVTDIKIKEREATVTGKGGKVRTIRFDDKAALALDRYLRVRAKRPAVTEDRLTALWIGVRRRTPMTPSGVRQALQRRGEKLDIELWPHLLRHTFAHRWLDNGGAEGDLEELAGWDSPQMLRHYGRSARSARARRHYDTVNVMSGL